MHDPLTHFVTLGVSGLFSTSVSAQSAKAVRGALDVRGIRSRRAWVDALRGRCVADASGNRARAMAAVLLRAIDGRRVDPHQRAEFPSASQDGLVNRPFSIPSCLIFDSSVDAGMPRVAAAPFGPATFPRLRARAASIISFS